jgi:predicted O-linked N-acetylglucosamine transferase (SPINDLY family)
LAQEIQKIINYLQSGNPRKAFKIAKTVLSSDRTNFDALHLGAIAATQLGRLSQAVDMYEGAINLDSEFPDLHNNYGNALLELDRVEDAISSYRRALEIKPDYLEARNNLGNAFRAGGQLEQAIECYRIVLRGSPGLAQAHNNLGNALSDLRQFDEAISCYQRALALAPNFAKAKFNFANTLVAQTLLHDAIPLYKEALELDPNYVEALIELGSALMGIGQPGDAIECFRRAVDLDPNRAKALSMLVFGSNRICDWRDQSDLERKLLDFARSGAESVDPFVISTISDESDLLLTCAQAQCKSLTALIHPLADAPRRPRTDKIRVAYVSTDFRSHPVAFVTAELFELHDQKQFELHAISLDTEDDSPMRARLEKAFEFWHEASALSDQAVAELLRNLEIDIVVDLMGYTSNCRPGILAHKPVPVQINYLGYPGTMGSNFMDYILLDPFIATPGSDANFAEKIVKLPHSYMPHDSLREIAQATPTRADCGLPDDGFVFCSFNNSFKIRPGNFEIWMRLLDQTPRSVLWLSRNNEKFQENLRVEAAAHGIDPGRIIFAPRTPEMSDHLARQKLADLFLDTLPYNAHVTALDALWVGLPVLTCAGRSFPGRVAGSLLQAIGLPELITSDLDTYEALALKLTREPELLAEYRARLSGNISTAPLFDSLRFTRNLEAAYTTMLDRWHSGADPEAFTVGDVGRSSD